jgi:AmiR/NasT family two-component response regulator
MERFELTEDRAMAYLMRVSQDQNTKLRELARQIVEGSDHGHPSDGPADDRH